MNIIEEGPERSSDPEFKEDQGETMSCEQGMTISLMKSLLLCPRSNQSTTPHKELAGTSLSEDLLTFDDC